MGQSGRCGVLWAIQEGSMDTTIIEGFRLSPQQRRLWLLEEQSSPFPCCSTLLLTGDLKVPALQEAMQRLVDTYEILRTWFYRKPGTSFPVQVVSAGITPIWQEFDLSDSEPGDRMLRCEELFQSEQVQALGSHEGKSLRLTLITLEAREHLLIVSQPSLCMDPWGFGNLVNALSSVYAACVQGREWAPEPLQYADLAEWQNGLLDSEEEDATTARDYWARCRAALPADAILSPDSGAETVAYPAQSILTLDLPNGLGERTASLMRRLNLSSQAFLLACWQAFLWRRNAQAENAVGVMFHGRQYEELSDAIGLFARALPVSIPFAAETSLVTVATLAEKTLRDHARYQEFFTWEEADAVSGGAKAHDYFCYGFEFVEIPQIPSADSLRFSIERIYSRIERFDILLSCRQSAEGELTLTFAFDPTLHTRTDIARLAGQFTTLLQSALQQPEAPVEALDILPQDQRQQLLVEWNRSQKDFPNLAVHHLFERHASTFSDAPALVCEGRQLSYRELNNRANQVAHWLLEQGVQPDTTVGLFLHRSIEAIVGMLAILKAGAAYLPLDPAFPKERLQFMLKDSQTNLVLTQQSLLDSLTGFEGTTLCLDSEWDTLQNQSQNNPATSVSLSDLVYVIYTSGSTGNPKGVLVEHRGLSNYVHSLLSRLQLPTGAKYASVSTLAADLGNTVVFGALCSGGCLHLIPADTAMDASALGEYMHSQAVDCLKIVPSHLSALLSGSQNGDVLPRQVLVLGGEASSWNLIDRVKSVAPSLRVFNHYGPTETTVGVLMLSVEGVERGKRSGVPLGRPLENVCLYVLDSCKQPVPIGVLGELYIGGAQVAGYLNRPELMRERYLPYPFGGKDILYKTGDVVRYREDGLLEFVGRGDDQVKIRGYRIELGEIESRLREHPKVKEAVVLALEVSPGEKRLVGYVVSGEKHGLEGGMLREYLGSRLPEYMVPGSFVWLDTLPLSPNGKVDRQALLQLEVSGAEETYVAPRTPVEEVLCSIWSELLGLERIGIHDNFFVIGGHSLLATQVVSRVRIALHVDVTMRMLFERPTVAELAEAVDTAQASQTGEGVGRITPYPRDRALPLSFSQQRLWFIDQMTPGSYLYNVPIVIRLRGELNIEALSQALEALVRRHEILRTTYTDTDGMAQQIIHAPAPISLHITDLSGLETEARDREVTRLITEEMQRPFDLAHAPQFRTGLLRLSVEEHILLITLHHIVSDGWSKGVLFRELG